MWVGTGDGASRVWGASSSGGFAGNFSDERKVVRGSEVRSKEKGISRARGGEDRPQKKQNLTNVSKETIIERLEKGTNSTTSNHEICKKHGKGVTL